MYLLTFLLTHSFFFLVVRTGASRHAACAPPLSALFLAVAVGVTFPSGSSSSRAAAAAASAAGGSQQEALGAVIDDATHPDKRKAHPEWGVKLKHRKTGAEGVIRVPKDFGACTSIEQALHHATVTALLTNPTPRVLLFAHGFDVEFFQAPASTPQPKITLT